MSVPASLPPTAPPSTIEDMLALAPIVPVLTIEDADHAVPLARALLRGGLAMLEITLRTPAALDAIARIAADLPDALVGAGTVTTPKDLRRAARAGARFAVSPGFLPKLAEDPEIPLLPGVATATEIMRAQDRGYRTLKLFPAEIAGGVAALRAFAGPFPRVQFCPTGGITPALAPDYLAQPNVLAVGGSWVAPRSAIISGNWDHIAFLAREAATLRPTPARGHSA